jgi:hypothetical protein
MAAGTWALTDDYWPLWGESVPQAPVDQPEAGRRLAVRCRRDFTADRGYHSMAANYASTPAALSVDHGRWRPQ